MEYQPSRRNFMKTALYGTAAVATGAAFSGCATNKTVQTGDIARMNFYLGLTGVDTETFKNLPGNIGITRPLASVSYDTLVKSLSEARVRQILGNMTYATRSFDGLPVTRGTLTEGGGRIVGLDDLAVRITNDDARRIVGKQLGRLTGERLNELFDGNKANGEMYQAWLIGEAPKNRMGWVKPLISNKK